ncbi:MAG TPA: sigma-54 dependent transcriptional regulator [Spirochaetia bacterium]|nr:sigma-54 dependent transcriptional regulator [Spirochaetia bacterium]
MATSTETILIVDDDELVAEAYSSILEAAGWAHRVVINDPREVMAFVRDSTIGAILLDLNMPHVTGQELLESITAERPEIPVIILTLEDNVDVAVDCMRIGAFDFMAKPVDENRLVNSVAHAVRVHALHEEVQVLSRRGRDFELHYPEIFSPIVTASDTMHQLFAYIETIAASPRAVLITGESGTGKELFARAVHEASGRGGQFVPVNVAGLDDTVFSDTLFGHRRGAFTGADSNRKGLVEQAAGGTLFLDEIGDLDNGAQLKLLRLLQEEEYYPLGSDSAERSTARIVAATNADLGARQETGAFRRDLYYRLMGHRVEVPPLRDRREDIRLLVDHFAAESYRTLNRTPHPVPPGIERVLQGYEFPGNVRELQAIVFDVVSRVGSDPISTSDLLAHPLLSRHQAPDSDDGRLSYSGSIPTLEEAERFLIREALEQTRGNQTAAAKLLGVSQSTLSRRLSGS